MSGQTEMERLIKLDRLPEGVQRIEATEAERTALARRFGIEAIHSLVAEITLERDSEHVTAAGRLTASIDQACAISGDPFRNSIDEPLALHFVPESEEPEFDEDEEVEIDSNTPDEIYYSGQAFDLGEAIAQSFGLAIDPYAEGPDAEKARKDAGLSDEAASGPFAALAALKDDQ